jgi:hypothetical protein
MAQGYGVNWPLSGAVTQAFDFMNSCIRTVGGQFGLVNITVGSTADPEVEKEILEGVGTYGRQLGRFGDVLRILVERAHLNGLPEEQKKAVRAFLHQVDMVDDIKAKH